MARPAQRVERAAARSSADATCPECGAIAPAAHTFCSECGEGLDQPARRKGRAVRLGDRIYYPAGFWRRAGAALIDVVVYALAWAVVILVVALVAGMTGLMEELAVQVALVAPLLIDWASTARGGSPGRRAFGMRLIRGDGYRPGAAHGFTRSVTRLFSAIPLLLGFAWAGWDRNKQTWQDKMADTYVVHNSPGFAYREPNLSAGTSRPLATKGSIWAWGAVGGVVMISSLVFAQAATFEDELVLMNETNAAVSVVVDGEQRGIVQAGDQLIVGIPYFDPPRRYQGFHPDGALVFDAILSWDLLLQYDFRLKISDERGLRAADAGSTRRAALDAP